MEKASRSISAIAVTSPGPFFLSLSKRADLSESIVAAIAEMLREAFSMSRAFAASLVEQHYTGLHVPAYFAVEQVEES